MAVRVTRDVVCDMCGQDDSVTSWRITRTKDGKSVSPDLCAEHAEVLEDLFKRLPARKGRTPRRVLTEAEVVAEVKAAQRRKKP